MQSPHDFVRRSPLLICLSALATALCIMFVACASEEPRARIPAALQGEGIPDDGWSLSASSAIDTASIPEALSKLGASGGTLATYNAGERQTAVRVYELPGNIQAFEAVQTYPRKPDEYYFQMGASFVVVEAAPLSEQERRPFLLAFQAAAMPNAAGPPEN